MEKTVLLAGGSGLIGRMLQTLLLAAGYKTRILTRTPKADNEFFWDPEKELMDETALLGVDCVVNLAGEGIADKRWTKERQAKIIASRVQSSKVLIAAISKQTVQPGSFISASGIGFYGNSGEKEMQELDKPMDAEFMSVCCQEWENSALLARETGLRTAVLRIGIVLAKEGGALGKIALPVRWSLGSYFGNGQAWWSWIHIEDVCRMVIWMMEQEHLDGIYNAVAPNPVRGKDLTKKIAQAFKKRVIMLPVPVWVLKLMLGKMSAVILNSNKVSAEKILSTGFKFKYPEITPALSAIIELPKQLN